MNLIEQKKRIAEKLMGWDLLEPPIKFMFWEPEKGGKDLTEVLAKVDLEELYLCLSHDICFPTDWMIGMKMLCWFQDSDNAPQIVKAIAETLGDT